MKGAYAWSFIYLQRYLANARPELRDTTVEGRIRTSANLVLSQHFETDPCFRIVDDNGNMVLGLDESGAPIPGC
jgi:hypothetical protein